MADVRSLLRNELASRKATSQPNTTGNRVSKKRKVENGDGVMRKKLRSTGIDSVQAVSDAQPAQSPHAENIMENEEPEPMEGTEDAVSELPVEDHDMNNASAKHSSPSPVPAASLQVDEDEWAAFEREVVEPTKLPPTQSDITAHATISAAPITAAELAAQQERDKATATQTREAELEGEREDAARLMEDELDEMDQLEERVRKLKHRRDELRQNTIEAAREKSTIPEEQQVAAESESESEDEEEDWDDWRFK